VDILLERGAERLWVEVKNVTLVEEGHARFPDAPTERGRKHLRDLQDVIAAGDRAALVFCIQREDAATVGPADDVDPAYGELLRKAAAAGLEVIGLGASVSPRGIELDRDVPLAWRPRN
jgi:sugar fermentation stimulation protein A